MQYKKEISYENLSCVAIRMIVSNEIGSENVSFADYLEEKWKHSKCYKTFSLVFFFVFVTQNLNTSNANINATLTL